MSKILLIDDDKDILQAIRRYFEAIGYEVFMAENGKDAIEFTESNDWDCIVLDVMLPDMDGFAVCECIRNKSDAPIIFLSCKDEVKDKINGLMSGGDDYMTKPFFLAELEARVHARIRRNAKQTFSIDTDNRTIVAGTRCMVLSQKDFELFMLLYENSDRFFTVEEIGRKIWKEEQVNEANNVAVHIKRLRDKLEGLSLEIGTIQSAYKQGYKFVRS